MARKLCTGAAQLAVRPQGKCMPGQPRGWASGGGSLLQNISQLACQRACATLTLSSPAESLNAIK